MTPLRRRMIDDMRLRNLAPKTIEVYTQRVAAFAKHFKRSPRPSAPTRSAPTSSISSRNATSPGATTTRPSPHSASSTRSPSNARAS